MTRARVATAVVVLAFVSSSAAVVPAAATTSTAAGTHKLIVAVKKLSVLVVISQNGSAPAAALATPGKPLTVRQSNGGLYRVKVEIDSSCKGGCNASYRIAGSADHKLEVIPDCGRKGSGFVCRRVEIVKVY